MSKPRKHKALGQSGRQFAAARREQVRRFSRERRAAARLDPTGFPAPIERAKCVPECTWLETRQHEQGCES